MKYNKPAAGIRRCDVASWRPQNPEKSLRVAMKWEPIKPPERAVGG